MDRGIAQAKWRRTSNGMIGGVCAGIARTLGIDPWVVRGIWIAAALFAGTGVLLYLVSWLALPHEDSEDEVERPVLLGVCLRIAHQSSADVGLVRLLAALLIAGSVGLGFVAYLVLHFLLKDRPATPL